VVSICIHSSKTGRLKFDIRAVQDQTKNLSTASVAPGLPEIRT